jgi:hypothetical protein
VQVGSRIFIAQAYVLILAVGNDAQALITVNSSPFCHLNVIQVPVFRDPAIAVIDFHVAAGCFENGARRRRPHPKIRSIHPNVYIFIWGKVHRAAYFIVMRAGGKPPGAIVKPIHGNPGFSLRPGQLKDIRGWCGCQGGDFAGNKGKEQSQ